MESILAQTERFRAAGMESPRLEAELLLAHVLDRRRLELVSDPGKILLPAESALFNGYCERRLLREPWQYITGSTDFCGLEFEVSPAVLIPRPETEILAELGWTFLKSRSGEPPLVLDWGTGSGCLAITLACQAPQAQVYAVDISPDALAVAGRNAARHGKNGQVHFLLGDGFSALPRPLRFDLVVANPPYIASAEIPELQPEVGSHEPQLALDGGPDGLDFYRRLAEETSAYLSPEGRLLMEIGDGQETAIEALFKARSWPPPASHQDYSRRIRCLAFQAGS